MTTLAKNTGPYGITGITEQGYLDILSIRSIPAAKDDILYTITAAYTHRPDLLAFDLYGSKDLWWIFAQRNLDILKDPVYDFVAGTQIFLPQERYLKTVLRI